MAEEHPKNAPQHAPPRIRLGWAPFRWVVSSAILGCATAATLAYCPGPKFAAASGLLALILLAGRSIGDGLWNSLLHPLRTRGRPLPASWVVLPAAIFAAGVGCLANRATWRELLVNLPQVAFWEHIAHCFRAPVRELLMNLPPVAFPVACAAWTALIAIAAWFRRLPAAMASAPMRGARETPPLAKSETNRNKPAATQDPYREIDRIFKWLDAPERPVEARGDDQLRFSESANSLLGRLRPTAPDAPPGTLCLIGPRGSGKSSLLRIASNIAKEEEPRGAAIGLRLCFTSLWGFSDAGSMLAHVLREIVKSAADQVDPLVFSEMPRDVARSVTGAGGYWSILSWTLWCPADYDQWLLALSSVLVSCRLRIILCIEDDDRVSDKKTRADFNDVLQGLLDKLRALPGFGYVVCVSMRSGAEEGEPEYQRFLQEKKAPPQGISPYVTESWAIRLNWLSDLGGLPIARLCSDHIDMRELPVQEAVDHLIDTFHQWMLVHGAEPFIPPTTPSSGLVSEVSRQDRGPVYQSFLTDKGGLDITPRTLRNGLRQARRVWRRILAQSATREGTPHGSVDAGIDPDSVLAAMLIRAARPESFHAIFTTGKARPAEVGQFLGLGDSIWQMLQSPFVIPDRPSNTMHNKKRPGALLAATGGGLNSGELARIRNNRKVFLEAVSASTPSSPTSTA